MHIAKTDLDQVDLERLRPFTEGEELYFKLLTYLSTRVSGTIFDLGTYRGNSALALSYGGNPVESFDVADHLQGHSAPANVRYHLDNLYTTEGRGPWREQLLASPLIFVDTDPHEGSWELNFVQWVQAQGYLGRCGLSEL